MEQLINRILKAGGTRADLEVKIFGGGRVSKTLTDVGDHNVVFVREFLKQEGLRVTSEDVGDTRPRHVQYFPLTGRVRVRHLTSSRHTRDVASQDEQFLKRPGEDASGRRDRFVLEGRPDHGTSNS